MLDSPRRARRRLASGPVRRLALVLAATAVAVAGCSGSGSGNTVPLDSPAPGVLYVSTQRGGVQQLVPATGATEVVSPDPTEGNPSVVDVAPTADGTGVNAIVQVSTTPFTTALTRLTNSGLRPAEAGRETVLSCLDPHPASSTALVHQTSATVDGAQFVAATIDADTGQTEVGGTRLPELELLSVSCPRWSGDRTMVATATALRAEPSSVVTVVRSNSGEQQIGFDGCGTTPTSFSPDDRFLAVALTCYAAEWEKSGLYLVPVDALDQIRDLGSLTRLESTGLYGRSAWHPDGGWIAVGRADAIERQNIAQDLSAQPVTLRVIEVGTGQVVALELADDAAPFAIAWLNDPLAD